MPFSEEIYRIFFEEHERALKEMRHRSDHHLVVKLAVTSKAYHPNSAPSTRWRFEVNKLTEGKIKQQRIAIVLIELRNQYAEARQEEERRQGPR